jgi:hypothetical protein
MEAGGITTGVLGGRWRATVTPWGGIQPWPHADGIEEPPLEWHIAADDRWHTPAQEPAVRQQRVEGTAVVETRVRIPNGDAVQRVYSVPDHGGLTIVEVFNESPLAIAVAFTRGDLLSARPATAPIEGIDLPTGSVAFPIGHHATVTVAIPHRPTGARTLPSGLVPFTGVVRGWLSTVERAGRLLLPDVTTAAALVSERCELALAGPTHPDDDPVGFLLGVAQLVRMGEPSDAWLPDVAHAVEMAAKHAPGDWALGAALAAATEVFRAAGDRRAMKDLDALRRRTRTDTALPASPPEGGARLLAWWEQRLVAPVTDGAVLLVDGLPADWAGNHFEVYGLPNGAGGTVSYAVRWHGARPAVLWEQTGAAVTLTSPLAPQWTTTDAKGETLWPQPTGVSAQEGVGTAEGESFS